MDRPTCKRPNCSNVRSKRHSGYCQGHYRSAPDKGYVDATESVDHVARLRAVGYAYGDLVNLTGLDRETLRNLGKWTDRYRVTRRVHDSIMSIPLPSDIVAGGSQDIPAAGTRRRLQALIASGYSQYHLGKLLGVTQQCVATWLHKDVVAATTARRVADLFNTLQLTPGPSKRAVLYGQRHGFSPPLAWDEDIDDPDARPASRDTAEDFADQVADHRAVGHTDDMIAVRMGITFNTLSVRLRRAGIPTGRRYRDIEDNQDLRYNNAVSKRQLGAK